MKYARKLLAILCVAVMIATVFTGCKDNPDEYSYYSEIIEIENSKPQKTESKTESETSVPTNSSVSSDQGQTNTGKINPEDYRGKTVTYATWDRAEGIDTDKVIIEFRKKYGINVQIKKVSQSTYVQEVFALNQSGNGPDIIRNWDYWPAYLTIGQPVEVAKMDLSSSIFDKAHMKAATVNGKIYSVQSVQSAHSVICYYNKKLLKANGFRTPDEYEKIGQWSYDALEKIMNQVKGLGKTYFGGYIDYYGLRLLDAYGTGIYTWENGKFGSGIGTPEFEKITVKVAEWNKAGLLASGREAFVGGKAGIAITDLYGLKKTGYWKDMNPADIGYIKLPTNMNGVAYKENKMFTGLGIGKKSKEPVAAGIFLQYYLSPDIMFRGENYISADALNFATAITDNSANDVFATLTTGPNNALGTNKGDIMREVAFTDPTNVKPVLDSLKSEYGANVKKLNDYLATNAK